MHDTELEQRLRATLRDEADRLPFHVDVERLEAAVAVRRRARTSNRFGLLAAAVGVIALGIAAAGLTGLLPTGILPGVAPATPVACQPLVVSSAPASVDGATVGTPPRILLVDAAGVAHTGRLDSFRMPGLGRVPVGGAGPAESRLDPRTTSLEVTTAEHTCLLSVELEIRPPRDGASPVLTYGAEDAGQEPHVSLSITAPPRGEWHATVRATFGTTADAMAISVTTFRLVTTTPDASATPEPPSTPMASALPAGLTTFEPRPNATILADVPPTWATEPTRRTVELPDSTSEALWIQVACIDPDVTVGAEGEVTDLDVVKVHAGDEVHEVVCMPDGPFGLTMPLTAGRSVAAVDVPDGVAWTALVEAVPVPDRLPTIEIEGGPEVEGSSTDPSPDWTLPAGTRVRTVVGTVDEGFSQEATFVCLGPGSMSVEFRTPGSAPDAPANSSHGGACLGEPEALTIAVGAEGPHEIVVETDARTAWHLIARSDGEIPAFTPPSLRMTSWLGSAEVDGAATAGVVACGYSWDIDGNGSTGDQCGSPEWPEMTDTSPVIARAGGGLRLHLDDTWSMTEHVVRAAPYLQTGQFAPPVNVRDLESSVVDGALLVPVTLSNSRWVIRVEVEGTRDGDTFRAQYFFVVDVQA